MHKTSITHIYHASFNLYIGVLKGERSERARERRETSLIRGIIAMYMYVTVSHPLFLNVYDGVHGEDSDAKLHCVVVI